MSDNLNPEINNPPMPDWLSEAYENAEVPRQGLGQLLELIAITTIYRQKMGEYVNSAGSSNDGLELLQTLKYVAGTNSFSDSEPIPDIVPYLTTTPALKDVWEHVGQLVGQPQDFEEHLTVIKEQLGIKDRDLKGDLDQALTNIDLPHPEPQADSSMESYVDAILTQMYGDKPQLSLQTFRSISGSSFHDIRSPMLTNIMMAIDLMGDIHEKPYPDDNPHSDVNQVVLKSIRVAYDETGNSKYNKGLKGLFERLHATNIPFDGIAITNEVISGVELAEKHFYQPEKLSKARIKINLDQDPQIRKKSWIVPNESGVEETVQTLFDNSLKYGGENPHIEVNVSINPQTKAYEITITDDGPGWPNTILELVQEHGALHNLPDTAIREAFEKLETQEPPQPEENSNLPVPSQKLGLIAYAKLINHAGGTLTISNRPEGGAQATISLSPEETNKSQT